jgi:signal transduction histidine kinase
MSIKNLMQKSSARRIFTFVIISFVILTGHFISQFYFSTLNNGQALTLERLESVANIVALQIDGDEHELMMQSHKTKDAITKTNSDATYDKIHKILQNNLQKANLKSPIYTYVYNDKIKSFEFGATSSDEPYFRHQYNSPPPDLIANREKGGKLEAGRYEDEFGHWLSAFATIKNKEGRVVALVQVDEKFDNFISQIYETTLWNILHGMFAFVVVTFFMLRYLKKVLAKEESNKQSISEAYEDKKAISEKLYESELQLKEYAIKLEKSNQELTDFANIASHDMKAPVRNILSFAQLFERRNKDKFDERDAEYFGFIKTNANQCIKLIESLLNYSKADKNIGEPSELDVFDAVVSAQNNLTAIIDERNAMIKIDDLPTIEAHPMLISQLFQNLINNGIKYNQSAQPSIHIWSEISATEGLVFAVKDNGIGIPEKHKQDVFAMFRRLHSASEYEGSGIGLAFCKRIVETYEGRMWLESEVGVGSTFFFTLPKAKVLAKKKVLEIA